MKNAQQIVNMMLETASFRVCSECEKEFGPLPEQPGVQKSHGLCRRHAIAAYQEAGIPTEKVQAMPDENFPPDRAGQR